MATVDIPGDDAVHAIEIASIGITLINALSSAVLVLLVLFDNVRHQKSWWNISWERRVPFYLGLSVLFSHVVFATREFLEFNSVNATDGNATNGCVATNESSWWGIILSLLPEITLAIWFPLIATSIRVLLMATSIILKVTDHHFLYLTVSMKPSQPLMNVCTYSLSQRSQFLFGCPHTYSTLRPAVRSSWYFRRSQTLLLESQL